MKNNIKKRAEGFTIIEVLIVLAIAMVIILIVFFAIPGLRRNSRNTQRRTEVSRYAGAVSEWANNNNGVLPSLAADLTTPATGVNAFANMSVLTAPTAVTGAGVVANTATVTTILFVTGTVCAGTNATNVNASTRQFTILYATESSTGTAIPQCLAS